MQCVGHARPDATLFVGEAPALLPAISMILHFSPAEVKRCQEALARQAEASSEAAPNAPAAGDSDVSSYFSGLASWAFGEGQQQTPR